MMRMLHLISFTLFYIGDIVKSNFRVAHDALTPTHHMQPGIMAVDVSGMTNRQLLFMANFITMTPGTLGLIFSDTKDKLYIHTMYVDGDIDALSAELAATYGKRVRRVF
jgi:multicomponent Na+:H+ antiporter subunit E